MGKRGKPQRHPRKTRGSFSIASDDDNDGGDVLPSAAYSPPSSPPPKTQEEEESEEEHGGGGVDELSPFPSKFELYQLSVQSPKGDISYMQKFFLMYVGGRIPLHLQEDFCGTALLSVEWLRSDPRRTAVGLDLDLEALNWCLGSNLPKIGAYGSSRISLFHGNVLNPGDAHLVKSIPQDFMAGLKLNDEGDISDEQSTNLNSSSSSTALTMKDAVMPARDIVCAFNYSCCCLQKRADLVLYFKHVCSILSKKGGIFVMDIYGGTSSEGKLRLQRKYPKFMYYWEQADFDIINRRTKISLHFKVGKKQTLRHAFSYSWRLWSLPEIKDCLEEAGFQEVHFWMKEMPDTDDPEHSKEYSVCHDVRYEEVSSFQQQDAWNAYIVAVGN